MPRIARGGVGGAAHRRSGPSAFELAFPNTWAALPLPHQWHDWVAWASFGDLRRFWKKKLNLTQIPFLPASPPPFLPHYFFPFLTSFLGLLSGRKPTTSPPLSSLTRDEMTRPPKFLGRTFCPLLRILSPSPLCHLLVSWGVQAVAGKACSWILCPQCCFKRGFERQGFPFKGSLFFWRLKWWWASLAMKKYDQTFETTKLML